MKLQILSNPRSLIQRFCFSNSYVAACAIRLSSCSGTDAKKLRALAEVGISILSEEAGHFEITPTYTGFVSNVIAWLWEVRPTLAMAAIAVHSSLPLPKLKFPSFSEEDFVCPRSEPLSAEEMAMVEQGAKRRPQIKRYLGEMVPYLETVCPGDRPKAIRSMLVADQATLREMFERWVEVVSDDEAPPQEVGDDEVREEDEAPPSSTTPVEKFMAELPNQPRSQRNDIYRLLGLERPPRGNEFALLIRNFNRVYADASVEGRKFFAGPGPLISRLEGLCRSCA